MDKRLNIYEECERCLLCQDAPCTKACKTGDTARAIRAIRPIAMRHIFELASMPQKTELSGIGGIETWRDALEFIQLGCSNVQVCTAVMQFGYRIIDDLILGLQRYMAKRGVTELRTLVGEEVPKFVNPDNQAIVFDAETRQPRLIGSKCVGCHLCRLVCPSGAIGISKRVSVQKKAVKL